MESYSIEIKNSAVKELGKLPKVDLKRIVERIQSLSSEPRPAGCKKLSADEKYRLRAGNYRILYSIEENKLIIYIVKVGHRKDVYKMI
ncbi:MAG: type II toxin-antitoxin system RelE/ParE family toxin [Helicobacteraceae bacterium]|nr:type II toxin-antitoxin system RelE/ParE family toxin [Candidatus Sulfurimonas ponti]MBL6973688.1 type II toxin-antitoxin system RelE/ParE family toxin [Sulfurimonas sp.]